MSPACFHLLAEPPGHQERKNDTNFRTALAAEEKLLIPLG
jgi:hypothetical protein